VNWSHLGQTVMYRKSKQYSREVRGSHGDEDSKTVVFLVVALCRQDPEAFKLKHYVKLGLNLIILLLLKRELKEGYLILEE
jgi:hypothetical protein